MWRDLRGRAAAHAAVRHTDRSGSAAARRVTAILYLNPDWDPTSHGGRLCLYHTAPRWGEAAAGRPAGPEGYGQGETAVVVAPLGNRVVAFESGVPHEVLPAHADRCPPHTVSLLLRTSLHTTWTMQDSSCSALLCMLGSLVVTVFYVLPADCAGMR